MEIKRNNSVVVDEMDRLIEDKQGVRCGCKDPCLRITCHMDGTDFYQSVYKCECGNVITVTTKREKGGYWYDGE